MTSFKKISSCQLGILQPVHIWNRENPKTHIATPWWAEVADVNSEFDLSFSFAPHCDDAPYEELVSSTS